MIKRICFGILTAFMAFGLHDGIQAQGMKGRFGFGIEGGQQQLTTSDIANVQPELGGEAVFSYRLSDRISLNLAAGYSKLSSKTAASTSYFTTDLITGNLYLDAEAFKLGPIRPFIRLGFGGFNFKATSGKRFNDGEVLGGGGLRLFLGNRMAVSVGGFGKYTTGDDLDGVRSGGKDIYWGLRGGITFYSGGRKQSVIHEPMITESQTETPDDTSGPEPTAGMETGTQLSPDIQEIQALQERKETLQRELSAKEQEIEALRQAVSRRETEIESLQGEIQALKQRTPAVSAGNFREAYQQALRLYENRRYREAIQAFQSLLTQNPRHRLASNCWYWIGESYFALGELDHALQAFTEVLNYTGSFKKDDALLMMGRIYMRKGQPDMARQMFNRLLQEHPDSEYAPRARQYLNRLQ